MTDEQRTYEIVECFVERAEGMATHRYLEWPNEHRPAWLDMIDALRDAKAALSRIKEQVR